MESAGEEVGKRGEEGGGEAEGLEDGGEGGEEDEEGEEQGDLPGPGGLVEGGVVVFCEEGEKGSYGVGTGVWALGLDDVTAEGGEGDAEDAVEAKERAMFVYRISISILG